MPMYGRRLQQIINFMSAGKKRQIYDNNGDRHQQEKEQVSVREGLLLFHYNLFHHFLNVLAPTTYNSTLILPKITSSQMTIS